MRGEFLFVLQKQQNLPTMNNRVKTVEAGREFRNFIKTMKDIKFVNIKRYKIIFLEVRKNVELIENSMKNWLKFSQKLAKKQNSKI